MAPLKTSQLAGGLPARLLWVAFFFFSSSCLIFADAVVSRSVAQSFKEYDLKAVFLFNFAQFVEWPAEAFPDAGAPLVIGVLGSDPFGAALDQTVRGEMANGHPFLIKRYADINEVSGCHILFISRSETAHLGQIVDRLRGRNILTVSDADDFAERGGMILFVTENNRIRLKINVAAAKAAKLSLSSKLLRPAEIVGSGQQG
jgi:hypothetical protein